MKLYQKPFIGTYLMLIKDGKLLLQCRKGGPLDGVYTPVAGHVDERENVIEAIVREAKEEAGIIVNPDDLQVSVIAHLPDTNYKGGRADIINFFCFTDKYQGEVQNQEPDICSNLGFYDLTDLPANIMKQILQVLEAYNKQQLYLVIPRA